MNAQDAREQKKDVNWFWTGEQEIENMNQNELLEYSNYLGALSNETFEGSATRFRNEGDPEIANIFDEMTDRWFELDKVKE